MYKLVISSFDNTLINSEEAIFTSTMIMLDEIRSKGILFGITTDRCYKDILSYNRDFPFIDYIISYNGAYVYDVKKDKCIFKKNMLMGVIKKIYKLFINYDLLFYTDERVYFNKEIDDDFFKMNKIYKMSIICNEEKEVLDLEEKLKSLSLDINYYINFRDNKFDIDIIRGSINKLVGLNSICKDKILNKEVIAIGYDKTDIDILSNVGCSFVVSNGDNDLKKIVDFVTSSNDEKGVEEVLRKIL